MDEQTAGMNVSGAWPRSKGAGTVVAVIDTGITSHSDLNANLVPGYDFISDPNIARDGNGRDSNNTDAGDTCDGAPSSWHGTHVAGTIGAVAYNGRGVVGVAYETKIQPIRALGACGGYLSDISDALTWAVGGSVYGTPFNSNPADVVNMSLGGSASQCSATFQTALNYAASRNATVIAAAGNENSPVSGTIPANCDKIITVGATGREGNRAGYSNYGPAVDISAPGGDFSTGVESGIVSTYNDGETAPGGESYAYMQGTSMAAPHVAAVAAIMRSTARSAGIPLSPAEIEEKLKATARPLPGACDTGGCGTGLVDAAAAARAANPAPLQFRTRPVIGIGSVAAVGDELGVNTTASSFGPAADTLTYQWLRDGNVIPDATDAAYRITEADIGARLSIRMIASKFDYQDVTITSTETDPVTERSVTPAPTIAGTPQVDVPLKAVPGTWSPGPVTFQYQWLRGTEPIEGATYETYTPVAGDAGQALKVRATGSGPNLAETSVESEPTADVLPGALSTAVPEINGAAKIGSRLQSVPGTWTEGTTLTHQWLRDGAAIPAATGAVYDPTPADLDKAISLRVTGTKDGYTTVSKESVRTAPVEAGTLSAPVPQITGEAAVGLTLTANTGDWGEGTSLSYQWLRGGTVIFGATGSAYTLTADDQGNTLSVRVTGQKDGYSTVEKESEPTGPVALGTFSQVQTPRISGTLTYPAILSVPQYEPDLFSSPAAPFQSKQWYRDGVAIPGATGQYYNLQVADVGRYLSVRLTVARAGYIPYAAESVPAKVAPGVFVAPTPVLTGTAKTGNVLKFDTATWNTGSTSPFFDPQLTKRYQWYRAGVAVPGEIGPGYLLSAADVGKRVKMRATIAKPGYATVTKDSAEVTIAPGTLNAPLPGISGTRKVGYTLTATPGTWTAGTTLRYQWYRSGVAITGATGSRYTLGAADLGRGMKVRVTGSKAGYTSVSKDSSQTAAVVAGTLSGPNPWISGTLRSGYVLTANTGTWTAGTTLRYQWYRSGVAIKGATGRQYRLVTADRYDTIRVRVIGSKPGYTSLARYSGITRRIP
jgi:hypothetical protein